RGASVCCICAHSTPGYSVEESPRRAKHSRKPRRSIVIRVDMRDILRSLIVYLATGLGARVSTPDRIAVGLPEAGPAARVVSDNGVLWRANIAISTVNNGAEHF